MTLRPQTARILGFAGAAGDHNTNPVRAVPELLREVGRATSWPVELHGKVFEAEQRSSMGHLEAARPELTAYGDAVSAELEAGHTLVCVNGRCATSLVTIPRVLAVHPEAVVVWLDAHADLNVPDGTGGGTDYLGGMAVSGPLGWWDSGFGAGLSPEQLVLVGTRSIDAPETKAIEAHRIPVLAPQVSDGAAVAAAVGGRPVFFHLDCDVLEPGIFRTDYKEPSGLSLAQLEDIASALAASSDVVGVEIAEWEGPGTHTATDLVSCLAHLFDGGADAK